MIIFIRCICPPRQSARIKRWTRSLKSNRHSRDTKSPESCQWDDLGFSCWAKNQPKFIFNKVGDIGLLPGPSATFLYFQLPNLWISYWHPVYFTKRDLLPLPNASSSPSPSLIGLSVSPYGNLNEIWMLSFSSSVSTWQYMITYAIPTTLQQYDLNSTGESP